MQVEDNKVLIGSPNNHEGIVYGHSIALVRQLLYMSRLCLPTVPVPIFILQDHQLKIQGINIYSINSQNSTDTLQRKYVIQYRCKWKYCLILFPYPVYQGQCPYYLAFLFCLILLLLFYFLFKFITFFLSYF
jgi:hypothetical protein